MSNYLLPLPTSANNRFKMFTESSNVGIKILEREGDREGDRERERETEIESEG